MIRNTIVQIEARVEVMKHLESVMMLKIMSLNKLKQLEDRFRI